MFWSVLISSLCSLYDVAYLVKSMLQSFTACDVAAVILVQSWSVLHPRQCLFSLQADLPFCFRLKSVDESFTACDVHHSRWVPNNDHQRPTVVFLCGPHLQGALGVNCARHMANHGAKVVVFAPSFMRMNPALETELKLLESTTATRTTSTKGQGPGEKLLTLVFFCLFACLLLFFLEEGISEMLQILMASIELCIFICLVTLT